MQRTKTHAEQVAELHAAATVAARADPETLIDERTAAKLLAVKQERLAWWRKNSAPLVIPYFRLPSGRVRYAVADVLALRAKWKVAQ